MTGFSPEPAGPYLAGAFFHHTLAPCRRRRYTVAVAAPFALRRQAHHGAAAPVEADLNEYRVYRWELRDLPGIEWDAWTPPLRDFAPWTDYSTLTSWEPVAAQLRTELMPREAVDLRGQAQELTRGATTERDKAAALYEYVAGHVRYGRPIQETYDPLSRPITKIAEDLRGDCKDKSALLLGLLHGAGVPASIALVSTRAQGDAPFLPAARFDHALVVAGMEDGRLWLDPTAGTYTFGDLPYGDQGVHALILDDDGPDYVEVPRAVPKQHGAHYVCRGRLDEAGAYRFQARVVLHGDRAAQWRLALSDRSEDYCARQIRHSVAHRLLGAEVGEVEVTDVKNLKIAFGYAYTVTLQGRARRIEKLLLFRVPWAEPAVYEGPLVAAERLYPLSAPLVQGIIEEHEIEVPSGFTGYGLPQESAEDCTWGSYRCSIRFENGRLRCARRLEFHGGITPAERFAEVKRFYEACVRSDEADVVLVEVTPGWPPPST